MDKYQGKAEKSLDKVVSKKLSNLKALRSLHISSGSVESFWAVQKEIIMWVNMLSETSVSKFDYDNPDFQVDLQNVTSLEGFARSTLPEPQGITFCDPSMHENQQHG